MIDIDSHPCLDACCFVTHFDRPLGEHPGSPELAGLRDRSAAAPFSSNDLVREKVRDLLRRGGFKPTGRSKPASEYLLKVAAVGPLPAINLAVDVCNVVSLHSGLPISVIDLDRATPPLRIGLAPAGASYPFNASGQSIDLSGLLCLLDAAGPCANAVKDAQRTKTDATTRQTLSVVWGTHDLPGLAASVGRWYRELLQRAGAQVQDY
jgi:DNA/RNA-binding domain of Phe-tRNA-synthetase-like protein